MEKSSFFNSLSGDRKYKAEDWAAYFASFIGNGVYANGDLAVSAVTPGQEDDEDADPMAVKVGAGKAWINGYFYVNTASLPLEIAVADGVLNRIDLVVLRWDLAARTITAQIKAGTSASSPAAPALQRDADGYELCLAQVYVQAGATAITQADITDKRLDSALCGLVAGVVQQIDTSTFLTQLEAWMEQYKETAQQDFESWFSTLESVLDENTAANLLNLINAHTEDDDNPHGVTAEQVGARPNTWTPTAQDVGARPDTWTPTADQVGASQKPVILTGTLTAEGWSGSAAPYTQTLTITGIPASQAAAVFVSIGVSASAEAIEAWGGGMVMATGHAANSIAFKAYGDKPTIALPVQVIVVA